MGLTIVTAPRLIRSKSAERIVIIWYGYRRNFRYHVHQRNYGFNSELNGGGYHSRQQLVEHPTVQCRRRNLVDVQATSSCVLRTARGQVPGRHERNQQKIQNRKNPEKTA